ncbi:17-beta-hydroxysteroid dehydrogenase 13-like isoform X2 [Biomphalaria glabrata]|uniref:Short-chain dehydrogenase/reductase 3 n=1 Tax=Biomphalaria glabrata TaxID=6526 RepID=A0A9W2ZAA1_BIOGL|nr:17-beta-hydroxysteroid dehydrogenase 13-like isoform X2 [Biomphalaria glabrata]
MGVLVTVWDLVQLWCLLVYNYILGIISFFVPPKRKSIAGDIALVTGAGHGIGKELALELSKLGAILVVWDVHKENNAKTAQEIKAAGGKAYAYVCDITNSTSIAEVAKKVRQDVGEVTLLVNNAGILNGGPFMELTEPDIRRTFEVNTLSHFWMMKEFLPAMIKQNRGHILNVISMAAYTGAVMMSDYCASKHAALGLFKTVRMELNQAGHRNIHMTALCPMFVDTGLVKKFTLKILPRKAAEALRSRSGIKVYSQYNKQD